MVAKPKKATTTKKPRAGASATAKRAAPAGQSTSGQFISIMVMSFTVLSIIFLLVVIQNYL